MYFWVIMPNWIFVMAGLLVAAIISLSLFIVRKFSFQDLFNFSSSSQSMEGKEEETEEQKKQAVEAAF